MAKVILLILFFLGTSSFIIQSGYGGNVEPNQPKAENVPDIVRAYWLSSKENQKQSIEPFITSAPISFWETCNGQNIGYIDSARENSSVPATTARYSNQPDKGLSEEQVVKEWQNEFVNLMKQTSDFIRNNHIEIIKIETSKTFGNESTVKIEIKNGVERKDTYAYLINESGQWKIFFIDFSGQDEHPYFAQERVLCK